MESKKIALVPIKEADIGWIAAIYCEEFGKPPYNEKWDRAKVKEIIGGHVRQNPELCFNILCRGEKAGFMLCSDDHWWVQGKGCFVDILVIGTEYQGKGIGSTAMSLLEKQMKKNGFAFVSVLSHRKSKSRGFYGKCGFDKSDYIYLEKELK